MSYNLLRNISPYNDAYRVNIQDDNDGDENYDDDKCQIISTVFDCCLGWFLTCGFIEPKPLDSINIKLLKDNHKPSEGLLSSSFTDSEKFEILNQVPMAAGMEAIFMEEMPVSA